MTNVTIKIIQSIQGNITPCSAFADGSHAVTPSFAAGQVAFEIPSFSAGLFRSALSQAGTLCFGGALG